MPAWRYHASWQTLNTGSPDELAEAVAAGAVEVKLPRVPKGEQAPPIVLSPALEDSEPEGPSSADD